MDSILGKMQDTAQKYVDILADILKIDVTITDSKQIRIAGSGRMRERIGDMSSYGYIVKHTLDTKQLTIVRNVQDSDICGKCPRLNICDNMCEVWLPLIIDDTVIGVLGFVCFDQRQKDHFEENSELFLQFLGQFGDLLVSKARDIIDAEKDQNVISLLENVIDRVEIGILVLDKEYKISQMNQVAKKILQIKNPINDLPKITFKQVDKRILDLQEYQVKIDDTSYLVAGKLFDINIDPYDKLFLFHAATFDKNYAMGLTSPMKWRETDRILGVSSQIQTIKEKIQIIAFSSSNVLITGESGTGKDLVAVVLHGESCRANYPFVAVNCASIPENLIESELFGYVKGAFTGADAKGRIGLFEKANGGTLFLDEIGDMPPYLQVKLLRVLEKKEITRLGSNEPIKIDVRLISATNKNMEELVRNGTFREDLYYRINVIPIKLPPLREHREDIRILAQSFIEKYSSILNKTVRGIGDDFWEKIENYPWPGNIRELQNTMEYVINMMPYTGTIHTELLPYRLLDDSERDTMAMDLNLEHMERELIQKAINIYGTSPEAKSFIAQKLGIGIATLYRKLKLYNL